MIYWLFRSILKVVLLFNRNTAYAPLLVTLGLLYPVAAMIRAIVWEKELRQKELMKMMSVTESDLQWSWFLSYFLFHFFTASFTAALTANLYSNSDGGYLWIFWILTFLAVTCFCMALTTLTSKSTRATLFGLLAFFIGYFLTLTVKYDTGSLSLINLISLHPVGAFTYGLQQIGDWEDKGVGVISSTYSITDNPSKYTFQSCLRILILDSILWGVVSWYLNRVLPGDYGQPLPWYFPLTRTYWWPSSFHTLRSSVDEEDTYDESIPVEPVSDSLKAQVHEGKGIEIRRLTKNFGDKTAVDCLNLTMYNGQITGLLGHNGAGKVNSIVLCKRLVVLYVVAYPLRCLPHDSDNNNKHADRYDCTNRWLRNGLWQRYSNADAPDSSRDWRLPPARLPFPPAHCERARPVLCSYQGPVCPREPRRSRREGCCRHSRCRT